MRTPGVFNQATFIRDTASSATCLLRLCLLRICFLCLCLIHFVYLRLLEGCLSQDLASKSKRAFSTGVFRVLGPPVGFGRAESVELVCGGKHPP